MSNLWITRIWASPEPSPSGKRLLLLALADLASDEGCCWPSVSTLARLCAVDPRTVRRYLAELEGEGFLRREMRQGRSTEYRLLQPGAPALDTSARPEAADPGQACPSHSGQPCPPTPDTRARLPRTAAPARTQREPSVNRAAALARQDAGAEQAREELMGLLVKRGVHEPVADRLVRRHEAAHIHRHVAHFDRLATEGGVRRGPGWLVNAIQEDYVIPGDASDPGRLFTHKEALAWIERSGITLSPSHPITRWFEPVRQPGGNALFRRVDTARNTDH